MNKLHLNRHNFAGFTRNQSFLHCNQPTNFHQHFSCNLNSESMGKNPLSGNALQINFYQHNQSP